MEWILIFIVVIWIVSLFADEGPADDYSYRRTEPKEDDEDIERRSSGAIGAGVVGSQIFGDDDSASSIFDDDDTEISLFDDEYTSGGSMEHSTINPATGLPMTGGMGGVDVAGNPFGTDLSDTFSSGLDDSFSSSFDDSFSSSSSFSDDW